MRKINSSILSVVITALLVVVVVVSSLTTSHIVQKFKDEEQKKIELWAEATRNLILAEEGENIGFLLKVLEGNTTIPVYMVTTIRGHAMWLSPKKMWRPSMNKKLQNCVICKNR